MRGRQRASWAARGAGEDEIFMATNYPHSDFWMRDEKRGTAEKPPFEIEARDSESAEVLGLVVVVARTKAADNQQTGSRKRLQRKQLGWTVGSQKNQGIYILRLKGV